MANFANIASMKEDLTGDPETVLCDLLADLMHWCDHLNPGCKGKKPVEFEFALEKGRSHYEFEKRLG